MIQDLMVLSRKWRPMPMKLIKTQKTSMINAERLKSTMSEATISAAPNAFSAE